MSDYWSVTVSRNGENIVTLEPNCLAGRELSSEDEAAIRTAASHLLAFIGDGTATTNAEVERRRAVEAALRELFAQIEWSNAVDDHGHQISKLKAVAAARKAVGDE